MRRHSLLVLLLSLGGCVAGPDYVRPVTELPEKWETAPAGSPRLADWWTTFDDPRLSALIAESLAHNRDLEVAAANVGAAAAALRLARADLVPTANAGMEAARSKTGESGALPLPDTAFTEYRGGLIADYEIDLWGRIRRANEAALAELRADVAVRDGVRAGIAASVARAYFQAIALDRRIGLLERLHETRTENLRLQKTRLEAGLISPYDYQQARSETAAVAAEIPALRATRRHAYTALAVLRGVSPREMLAGWPPSGPAGNDMLPAAPAVPMGLPSALLERRPDVRAAEQRLVAANARIGEARAAFFPRLSLTAFAGGVSAAFADLFEGSGRSWEARAGLAQPLTDLNRAGAGVDAARAARLAAEADYARVVQEAFRETLDSLADVSAAREVMRAREERVEALRKGYRTAGMRYRAGRIGYLELLDVERQLREVEQGRVDAHLTLLQATVDLYRALGGGWQGAVLIADGA